jgi:L-aminopeptidase/D-esterase-like protein
LGIVRDTHAVLLTGGSAFGLAAADGVVRFLEEKGVGLDIGVAKIPLVSAAVIFDLMFGSPDARPDADMGYKAAAAAVSSNFEQGTVGCGTGATVGKMLGLENAMKGGLGSASVELEGGLIVAALAVVNAVGDVRDEQGNILAGPRGEDGKLADSVDLMPQVADRMRWGQNTTLGIVATNARLTKPEATKVAQMSHDGLARAVYPVHTSVDGDAVFVAGVGEIETAPDVVGAWGARMMQESIIRAIRLARGLPGVPSHSEHVAGV